MEQGHKQEENLLTVFDPCGRVQPETDLFELWRLEGSRLTLRVDEGEGKREKDSVIDRKKEGNREIEREIRLQQGKKRQRNK